MDAAVPSPNLDRRRLEQLYVDIDRTKCESLDVDLNEKLEAIASRHQRTRHSETWGDDNGFSHLRASLMGPGVCLPIADGRPLLGTWQQIVLVDHDNRPRERRVHVQVVGHRSTVRRNLPPGRPSDQCDVDGNEGSRPRAGPVAGTTNGGTMSLPADMLHKAFQTAELPPYLGSTILPTMGWTRNSSAALVNRASEYQINMPAHEQPCTTRPRRSNRGRLSAKQPARSSAA